MNKCPHCNKEVILTPVQQLRQHVAKMAKSYRKKCVRYSKRDAETPPWVEVNAAKWELWLDALENEGKGRDYVAQLARTLYRLHTDKRK